MNERRRFVRALLLSLVLHLGAVLLVWFAPPPRAALRHDDSLQVILINSRGDKPLHPTPMVAQAALDAGGEAPEAAIPTAPEPPQPQRDDLHPTPPVSDAPAVGQSPAAPRTDESLRRSSAPATVTAPQQKKAVTPSPQPDPTAPTSPALAAPSDAVRGIDLLNAAATVAQLQAQLAAETRAIAERPRTRHVGVSVTEHAYALYLEAWREKVERIGTLNYPAAARGKLYGSLILRVAIDRNGKLLSAEVVQSSGHAILDEAALKTVHLAAPFARFPPEIAQETDILVITRRWTFTRQNHLTAQ